MARYRDIRRGARLNQALTNYQAYLARPISSTLPTYKPRAASVELQIKPFGIELPSGALARVTGNATWETIHTVSGVSAATSVAAAGASSREIRGFQPARVTWFRFATKSVEPATSKYTSQAYRKYKGDRFSMPFGQNLGTDREFDVADKIRTALKGATGFAVNRVSFTPERIRND